MKELRMLLEFFLRGEARQPKLLTVTERQLVKLSILLVEPRLNEALFQSGSSQEIETTQ